MHALARRAFWWPLLVGASLTPQLALSATCPGPGRSWVGVVNDMGGDAALADKVVRHLAAELGPRQIEVCGAPAPGSPPALAMVHIAPAGDAAVAIRIRVEDALTDKDLSRRVELAGLPADAHPLAIALGAAELLRASWVEITLNKAPPPALPVPVAVRQTVEQALEPRPSRGSMGLLLAGEEFTGGLRQAGVDVRLDWSLAGRFGLVMRVGGRYAPSVHAADGKVQADAWIAGVGPVLTLTPVDSPARVGLTGRVDVALVHFVAEPHQNATAQAKSGVMLMAGAGVVGAVPIGSWCEIEGEIAAGGVVRGVRATDARREVLAGSGGWVAGSLGLAVRF